MERKWECRDFDVLFSRSGDGYRAQVVGSPAGEGQSSSFGPIALAGELADFGAQAGRLRPGRVSADVMTAAAKQAGGLLFDSVFADGVGDCLRRSADQARDTGTVLRIRLRLSDVPELAGLPWELLYDRGNDWFLALSGITPVVRYVHLPFSPRPVRVALPLRILVLRSQPAGSPPLGLAAERAQADAALADLAEAGLVAITELSAPTLGELRRALARDTFHVLHYMGHGQFGGSGGVLLFTGPRGEAMPVTARDLAVMLADHVSLRLAVLNACETGCADPGDPFAGVADALVRRSIPAVIAMQFPVRDKAAIEFTSALYGALAAGFPVDAAVTETRKAIYALGAVEWAAPVLYLRAGQASLFEIAQDEPPVPDAAGGVPASGVVISGDNTGIVSTGANSMNVQLR
jgi:hypothetical protein